MTATEFLEGDNTLDANPSSCSTRLDELHALFEELHDEQRAAVAAPARPPSK